MTPFGNSCSCADTDCIGLPFRWTMPATPRGGSWRLGTPGSPYHSPRPAAGEVTPASLSQRRHNTGSSSLPVISPGSFGVEPGARGFSHSPPSIHIGSHKLNAVDRFQYLGSTISSNLSLEPEINSRIAKASAVMSKLHKRVWSNNNLTVNTKMRVYRACVLSTLLYSSETWTTYAAQEKRLNSFHLRCLRRILSIRWQEKIPNTVVLERAGLPSIFMLLSQRRLRWLGHVHRMADGRIPKDLLYGELSRGARSRGRPRLRFKDTCKRDLKSASIDIQS